MTIEQANKALEGTGLKITSVGKTMVTAPVMTFVTYSPLALRTVKPFPHGKQIIHAVLGLITELGELADNIKNLAVYEKDFDAPREGKSTLRVNMMEEVADSYWYINLFMVEKKMDLGLMDNAWLMSADMPHDMQLVLDDPFGMAENIVELVGIAAGLLQPLEDRGSGTDSAILEMVGARLGQYLRIAGYSLSDACKRNVQKLAKRYGDKYSDFAATNRDLEAEQKVLAGGQVS